MKLLSKEYFSSNQVWTVVNKKYKMLLFQFFRIEEISIENKAYAWVRIK